MENPLISYLRRRDELSGDEVESIERLTQRHQFIPAGQELVTEGSSPKQSCLLLEGYAYRVHFLQSGKRTISVVQVAGDFVDLHSLLLEEMDHGVLAASDCTVSWVAHSDIRRLTETHAHLTRLLWTATTIDAAMTRRSISILGGLPPKARLAHIACELYTRLSTVGRASGYCFHFPATQVDLSDICGISTVHLNRSLIALRETGMLDWQGGEIVIHDWEGLAKLGQFEASYLNISSSRR